MSFERLPALGGESRPGDHVPVGLARALVRGHVAAVAQGLEMSRTHRVAQAERFADRGERHLLDGREQAADAQTHRLMDDRIEEWFYYVRGLRHHRPRSTVCA